MNDLTINTGPKELILINQDGKIENLTTYWATELTSYPTVHVKT